MWNDTPCHETRGWRTRRGYGRAYWSTDDGGDGKRWYWHRRRWVEANGPIPDGLCVLHRCDNPPCGNPDHLFLGTQEDNMMDMASKGRARRVSDQQASQIRRIYARGGVSQRELARRFNVAQKQVWKAIHATEAA